LPGRLGGWRGAFPHRIGNRQFQQGAYLFLGSAQRRQYLAAKTHNSHQNGALYQQAREINPVILEPIHKVVHMICL
jgi:hypothetical protein